MSAARDYTEREMVRRALQQHWENVTEAERQEFEAAYLEAAENRLRRIRDLRWDIRESNAFGPPRDFRGVGGSLGYPERVEGD